MITPLSIFPLTSAYSRDPNMEAEEGEGEVLKEVEEEFVNHLETEQIQKELLEKIKEKFSSSFTVHGLSRILKGSSRPETIFWLVVELVGIAISSYVIYGLIHKYYRYEIYTDVSAKVTNAKVFPSITFCDKHLMITNYFAYCGIPHGRQKDFPEYCDKKLGYPPPITNILKNPQEGWSNGLFHVTKCYTWGGKLCANDKYLKSLRKHNHSCFVWNYGGNLHDTYSHTHIQFKVNKTSARKFSHMVLIFHDPEVTELELTNQVLLEPHKTYLLQIKETIIKRLPNPFPSNCAYSVPGVIFDGKYTRRKCIESFNHIKMLKMCGDALDYPKRFMSEDLIRKYWRNETTMNKWFCMMTFSKAEVAGVDDCPVPCEELELSVVSSFHGVENDKSKCEEEETYDVHIQYANIDANRIVEEKQLYSWDQIAGEVGGFLGLVIGASFISIVEIVLYLILCCGGKYLLMLYE